jgi:predicted transcriptional regulator YheO
MKNPDDIRRKTSKEIFLIESLKILVDGIARTFGPRCEVVLHDVRNLRNLDHSIVKIANGHVTGRTIGGSISDRGLRDLRSGRERDLFINYASVTKDGRHLKSSTILFRSDAGKPIAALCINFDVTDIVSLNTVIQEIFAISEELEQAEPAETFAVDMFSTLNEIADRTIRKTGKVIPSMGREDKIEIVRQLEDQGFFLIKGAIKFIAARLRVSKFTIYNYLEQIRSESQSSQLKSTYKGSLAKQRNGKTLTKVRIVQV